MESILTAVSPPYRVYGPSGAVVADGTVDGDPVALDPGSYRVEVLLDPPIEFADVWAPPGEMVELVLSPESE